MARAQRVLDQYYANMAGRHNAYNNLNAWQNAFVARWVNERGEDI